MEREELELIQKLQNTQMLQKAAYEDLEGALNSNVDMDQREEFSPVKSPGSRPQTTGTGRL